VSEGTFRNLPARNTLVQLLALYTDHESHNAQRYGQTDRRTLRQTNRRHDDANIRQQYDRRKIWYGWWPRDYTSDLLQVCCHLPIWSACRGIYPYLQKVPISPGKFRDLRWHFHCVKETHIA